MNKSNDQSNFVSTIHEDKAYVNISAVALVLSILMLISYIGKCATCVKHAFLKTHVKRMLNQVINTEVAQ